MNILDKYIKMEYGNKKDVTGRFLRGFNFSFKGIAPLTPGKRLLIMAMSFFLFSFAIFNNQGINPGCLYAEETDTQATDYCYVSNVVINNESSSTLTNFPVRVQYPYKEMKLNDYFGTSHSNNFNDAKLWDIKGVYGSLDNNVEFIASNIRNAGINNHYIWVVVSELFSGSNNLSVLMHNNQQKRDQGIYFYDANSLAYITDHNDLDVSSDPTIIDRQFEIHLDYKFLDFDQVNDGDLIISKYDESTSAGWKIEVEKNVLSRFKCTIGTDVFYSGFIVPDDEIHRITLSQYGINGVPRNYCAIDEDNYNTVLDTNYWVQGIQFGVSPTTQNVVLGGGIDQFFVYDIGIVNQAIDYNYIARFTLNAWDVSETDTSNPYGYDIDSTINNDHNLAYEMDANQSEISFIFGEPKGLLDGDITPTDSSTITTINPLDFSGSGTMPSNSVFGQFFNLGNNTGTGNLVYSILLIPIGLSFGAVGYIFTRSVMIASFIIGLPIILGISIGLLPYWFGMLWIITLLISMGVKEFGRG